MDIDSSPEPMRLNNIPPHDRIIQRLAHLGIPEENLKQPHIDLVAHVKSNTYVMDELVSAILPPDKEVVEAISEAQEESEGSMFGSNVEDIYHESMIWLQWLMFEGDASTALEHLGEMNGQRGVCGSVWGNNDIAYRCRTCEHDPTCAICVPCFQNGNHKDHDYSIIYTGGGCCDCGDVTAWKREGFCSKHRGAEQIQPLPEKFSNSMGPVLDSLLQFWKKKLSFAESVFQESPQVDDRAVEPKQVADELTSSVVEMLLEFCKHSESLLSFISQRVFAAVGLLDILVRAERFLNDDVVRKLHELLLKFLGEPQFKYEFAKVFLCYYPAVVKDAVKENNDSVFKKFALLSTFSVQILTVPTLTPRLVKEMNLLSILFDCLGEIFSSCAGEDNKLQVNKWGNLYETTIRVVEDIRFVMSHSEVPKYVTYDRRDLLRSWMRLLSFVQGMNPQKRETGIHVEEENENMHLPFVLCHSIANIHSLLVAGAFTYSVDEETEDESMIIRKQEFEDQDGVRHSKVGRLSEESSVSSVTGWNASGHAAISSEVKYSYNPLPSSVVWLTFECLKALENWLRVDTTSRALVDVLSPKMSCSAGNNLLTLRRPFFKFRREGGRSYDQEAAASDDCRLDGKHTNELEALRVLSLSDWREIVFDVSSQEISVHTPLHRLLSIILQRAFKLCYGESSTSTTSSSYSADPLPAGGYDFFGLILGGYHPHGFSAFLMEHPLRLRVFCAEVHAGMWRRNGDGAILSSEWYRSVRWSEQGLEFDLFLLQCCAALAPADLYVQRILERFGLSKYLSLNTERSSEYEPILVQEMITLIIQIIKERRFSGFSTTECLQRELVYKLSIGNAPRSQLVKSLPRDLYKAEKLQETLDGVADYSNPSGINQGTYKLKTQYWKELDLYHPRWNPRDLQIAEERFLRFCNCSALANQLPKWSKIYYPLRGVARVATCKTTAQIVHAVIFYAVFSETTASRAPDGVLIAALHLLSLALDICHMQNISDDHLCHVDNLIPLLAFAGEERTLTWNGDHCMLTLLVLLLRIHQKRTVNNIREASNYNISSLIENMLKKFAELDSKCMVKLQKLAPDVVSQVVEEVERSQTPFESDADKNKAKARERQAAMMEKMKAQQSKFLASIDSSLDDDMDDKGLEKETSCSDIGNGPDKSTQVICSLCHDPNSRSPVSYLVLLQKSRLLSFIDRSSPSWDQGRRSGKELASASSNKIEVSSLGGNTSQSSEMFSPKMFHLIQHAVNQFAAEGQTGQMNSIMEYIKTQIPSFNMPRTDAYFEAKTAPSVEILEEDIHTMVREEMQNCLPSPDFSTSFQKLPYIGDSGAVDSDTNSLFLAKFIAALAKETLENASGSDNSDGSSQFDGNMLLPECDGTGPYDCDGIYLTSCGHAVHQKCLDRYLSSLKERHTRRIVFEGGNVVDPDQGEFLCPVCRGLSNSVLPASSLKSDNVLVKRQSDAVSSLSFFSGGGKSLQLQEGMCLLRSASKVAGRNEVVTSFPVQCPGMIKLNLDPVSRVLGGMYARGNDNLSGSSRLGQLPLMLWDTLKYSLISTELASRSRKSSLAPNYSLNALYTDLKSSNRFILSLLLDIVQRVRTTNTLCSLLRLKGIQHFAQSICASPPLDNFSEPSSREGGNGQQIVESCGSEIQWREIGLWRRASDPIIARDPFSSFMWILFCLPSPFMMSEESFLSLLHMFYAVTMTQAAITYIRKRGWCIGYQDTVFTDIYKFMAEYEVGMQYFESNYIDSSKDMKDSIRRLSFPYLRKCALLWKLINSSQLAPFSDGTQGSVESTWMGDDSTEFTDNAGEELVEIEKLEKAFKIPPLDVVSEDGLLRSLVHGWLHHFSKDLEARSLPRTLYVTPVVPLRLMLLPQVYHDLLQRYIKQQCQDCGLVQDDPALCLVCGKLCSPIWKTCCRESGCQTHALSCGAGTGVFLLIRKTSVLLQRSGRQAPWPSPYLDSFGEEDIDMNRGKPLYLNEERYAALTHMVASHGLDRSSRVLRQTTIGGYDFSWAHYERALSKVGLLPGDVQSIEAGDVACAYLLRLVSSDECASTF